MNRLEQLYRTSSQPAIFARGYLDYLREVLSGLDVEAIGVKAMEYAKANGAFTVGLTGFDGGQLKQEAHLTLHIPTNRGEYGPAEDGHIIIDHLVGSYLLNFCRAEQRGEQ